MLAGRPQRDRSPQEGGTLAEAWEAVMQMDQEGQDREGQDREGQAHGGSGTLVGRLLHWSQPSRGLAWEALPLLGFVWGVSGPFPRQRVQGRGRSMKGRPAPSPPRYPPQIWGWPSRLWLCANRLCRSECVRRHKPATHPPRGLRMTVESQAAVLSKCSPSPLSAAGWRPSRAPWGRVSRRPCMLALTASAAAIS